MADLCGGCKHWVPDAEGDYARVPRWGTCGRIKFANEMDWADEEFKRSSGEIAGACDGSGYKACVIARDDFGCVLFEPKAGGD